MADDDNDWKLKLRYGRISMPYKHYTLIADGEIFDSSKSGRTDVGNAFMAMKVWASSEDEAFDMMATVSREVGFEISGRIHLYITEPNERPRNNPYGYDIGFTQYD